MKIFWTILFEREKEGDTETERSIVLLNLVLKDFYYKESIIISIPADSDIFENLRVFTTMGTQGGLLS